MEKKYDSPSIVDRFLEKLPEIHFIGYKYCGPNTNLRKRLAQGDPGVNALDCACKEHDIAYAQSRDLQMRNSADKILFSRAFKRIYAGDSRIGERFTAFITSGFISVKILFNKIEICCRHIARKLNKSKCNKLCRAVSHE